MNSKDFDILIPKGRAREDHRLYVQRRTLLRLGLDSAVDLPFVLSHLKSVLLSLRVENSERETAIEDTQVIAYRWVIEEALAKRKKSPVASNFYKSAAKALVMPPGSLIRKEFAQALKRVLRGRSPEVVERLLGRYAEAEIGSRAIREVLQLLIDDNSKGSNAHQALMEFTYGTLPGLVYEDTFMDFMNKTAGIHSHFLPRHVFSKAHGMDHLGNYLRLLIHSSDLQTDRNLAFYVFSQPESIGIEDLLIEFVKKAPPFSQNEIAKEVFSKEHSVHFDRALEELIRKGTLSVHLDPARSYFTKPFAQEKEDLAVKLLATGSAEIRTVFREKILSQPHAQNWKRAAAMASAP